MDFNQFLSQLKSLVSQSADELIKANKNEVEAWINSNQNQLKNVKDLVEEMLKDGASEEEIKEELEDVGKSLENDFKEQLIAQEIISKAVLQKFANGVLGLVVNAVKALV